MGYKSGTISKNGLWDPEENEQITDGHAMCLVGYDDNKFGGAFEVMNSWGTDFGDNGFIWIKYDDFIQYTRELYKIVAYNLSEKSGGNYTIYSFRNNPNYIHVSFKNGDSFEGNIDDYGLRKGFGMYYYNNGNCQISNYKNDKLHGKSWFKPADESKWIPTKFKNGVYVDKSYGFTDPEVTEENEIIDDLFLSLEKKGLVEIGNKSEIDILDYLKVNQSLKEDE